MSRQKRLGGGLDLLIGGSPCQDLSIAKKNRKGLDGERSGLFWEYVRILQETKPKYFVLENVNSMPSEAREIISKELGVEPIMINAALVSAQNRKRLFWTNIPDVKLPEDRGIFLKDILENGNVDRFKSYAIDANYHKGFNSGSQGGKPSASKGKRQSVNTNIYHIPHGYKKEKITQENKYPTLQSGYPNANHLLIDPIVRKLTPIECLRLQSLPDNYFDKIIFQNKPISNSQKYKMCGNAFNVEVVKHILKNLN